MSYSHEIGISGLKETQICKISEEGAFFKNDVVAVEEPLEIQLNFYDGIDWQTKSLSVTMRTPGCDEELAVGFLFTEGIIKSKDDIRKVLQVEENIIMIGLSEQCGLDFDRLQRHFYTTSSCGVCGIASIEMVQKNSVFGILEANVEIKAEVLFSLQQKLVADQSLFTQTGGIHAAALFSANGELQLMREDVGRHNALDKLVGASLPDLPLNNQLVLVSGRASFELVQKCTMAGVGIMVAIGAPSSLAVELAAEQNMCLIGFLKKDKFNIYSGHERVRY